MPDPTRIGSPTSYETAPGTLLSLTLTPEWYLVMVGLVALAVLGVLWRPLLLALPLLALAVGPLVAQSILSAARASFPTEPRSRLDRLKLQSLTAILHIVQPLARLSGRLRYGLTPWRRYDAPLFVIPRSRTSTIWSESWQAAEKRLETIEAILREQGAVVRRGGNYDSWDLEIRGGFSAPSGRVWRLKSTGVTNNWFGFARGPDSLPWGLGRCFSWPPFPRWRPLIRPGWLQSFLGS